MRKLTGQNNSSWLAKVSACLSRVPSAFFPSRRSEADLTRWLFPDAENGSGQLKLESGSRVEVLVSGLPAVDSAVRTST